MCTYSKHRSLQPGISLYAVKPRFSVLASQITSASNEREKIWVSLFFPQVYTLLLVFSQRALLLFELLLCCTSNLLFLPICQSEMTVVLCQTSYTSDWNPLTFHLKLISFLGFKLFSGWTSSFFPVITHIYCVLQRYKGWPAIYGILLNISIQHDTASHMDASHSLHCSSSYLICFTAFLLAHMVR